MALELLERGRAVILSLLIDDRSNTSVLEKADPDLCAKYESLIMELNTPTDSISDPSLRSPAIERRSKAVEELDECVRCIQQLPNFERFQKGLDPAHMRQCATEGRIIIVNITELRSDVIIVSDQGFSNTPLPRLTASKVKSWINENLTVRAPEGTPSKNPAYLRFLSWLWRACVKPILDSRGYQPQQPIDSLPRVWWIGTGLASSLPFHAAVDRVRGRGSAFSRVVSSYTPSIKALRFARERRAGGVIQQGSRPQLLIATMASTPGAKDLPCVIAEKNEVLAAVETYASVRILHQPDVVTVVEHLKSCNIAHFACHGESVPADPSESGLILETVGADTTDPTVDILSVRKISEAHLEQAEIAYLSACSTAENRAMSLEDEVLHVVSGFQVAGFRHVVGCLWPSLDSVCVDVAKAFYMNLVESGHLCGNDRSVAVALQKAVMAVAEDNDFRDGPLAWAQYVHFGA